MREQHHAREEPDEPTDLGEQDDDSDPVWEVHSAEEEPPEDLRRREGEEERRGRARDAADLLVGPHRRPVDERDEQKGGPHRHEHEQQHFAPALLATATARGDEEDQRDHDDDAGARDRGERVVEG